MTSTPYQSALMKIRRIYRWDDPMETGVYLASYLFLWAFDHLLGAAVSCTYFFIESEFLVLMKNPPAPWLNMARA